MANLSAALNSLASTTVMDFYRPLAGSPDGKPDGKPDDRRLLGYARVATVVWGVVLVLIGVVASHWGSVLESGLSIASVTLGMLLGVFLLGVLTKRVGEKAAIAGVLAGLAAILYVKFQTRIAYTWWVMIGSMATFSVGLLSSYFIKGESCPN